MTYGVPCMRPLGVPRHYGRCERCRVYLVLEGALCLTCQQRAGVQGTGESIGSVTPENGTGSSVRLASVPAPVPKCEKPAGTLCGERAGYAFHWCALPLGHEGEDCRCACGHVFLGTPF